MGENAQGNTGARPLEEAWWTRRPPEEPPPGDVPLLAPYEQTRPGYELGVLAADRSMAEYYRTVDDRYYQVCLWNIWEKGGDPAETDPQKQKINEMQRALGQLSDEDRYVRIQIACLARCFWTFPATLDLMLDGIASGQVNLDAGISCEPPWAGLRLILLRRRSASAGKKRPAVASLHHQQGLDPPEDQRQRLIRTYATILTWWSAAGNLDCLKAELPTHADLAETIYRRLGEPTRLKWLYVQKLRWSLSRWGIPALPGTAWPESMGETEKALDPTILGALAGEEDSISRLIDRSNDSGSCHHAFFRHVDHIIAHIGAGKPVPLPGAGEERRRIHGTVTNYVHVLGSWLAGRTPKEAVKIWPPCQETAARAYQVLGEPSPRKRWLVACLWKKLQEDCARNGRGALDEQPERFALPPEVMPPDRPPCREHDSLAGWRVAEGRWTADEAGRIIGESEGNGYLSRVEEHADDVRVTATMQAVAGIEITVWICGSPERVELDGYTLAVSTEKAKLQRKGEDVLTDPAVTIRPGEDHVLAFERRGATLRGFLDGAAEPFMEWTDPEPLRGEGHRTLGFYLWDGAIAVSDIRVDE